ncbi:MAG: DUF2341 domain-containing protein [Candidatus Bathyarchaeota archaeon]|nr:DUF2341 domain-containing protein [Candidatus Bathyarchaeota archaeon]
MKKLIHVITIIFLVSAISSCFLVTSQADTANWWDSSWQYRRQVTISEQSKNTLNQFPISITFDNPGKIQANGSDIRIVDSKNTEIPFSIETFDLNSATILLNIDLSAQESKAIYIYYGNPEAEAPNYPLIPLQIDEGKTGNATIDNSLFIGWNKVP